MEGQGKELMSRFSSITSLVAFGMLIAGPTQAELRVGIAKVDITPPAGVKMYGYGARGSNVSTGVHDRLYAKALVLADRTQTAAWVTMDLGYVDTRLTKDIHAAISKELGFDDVFLSSSHTHSGPHTHSSANASTDHERLAGGTAEYGTPRIQYRHIRGCPRHAPGPRPTAGPG